MKRGYLKLTQSLYTEYEFLENISNDTFTKAHPKIQEAYLWISVPWEVFLNSHITPLWNIIIWLSTNSSIQQIFFEHLSWGNHHAGVILLIKETEKTLAFMESHLMMIDILKVKQIIVKITIQIKIGRNASSLDFSPRV